MDDAPWPTELRVSGDRRALAVTFDDGGDYELPAEMLRVLSPSAEVQGHSPEQRVTVGGKRNITITSVEPVGNYAVRLLFADGHSTGIFTWRYLRDLGTGREALWEAYLDDLERAGKSRDA